VLAVAKDFAFVYDPKAGSSDLVGEWKRVGAFQITRSKFSLTSLNNGRVLAVGGTNEDTDDPFDRAATAELFEPVEDDTEDGEWSPGESGWKKIAELNEPRSKAGSAFLPDQDGDGRGRVLVMGGKNNKTLDDLETCALASAEVFDPRGDGEDPTEPVFLDAGNMTQERIQHSATSLQENGVLVVGGAGGCGDASAEVYTPQGPTKAPDVATLARRKGLTEGGARVRISGTAFTGATKVMFGDKPALDFWVENPGELTAVAPPHAPGTVSVQVTTPRGSSPPDDADAAFTYVKKDGAWVATDDFEALPNYEGVRAAKLGRGGVLAVFEASEGGDKASVYDAQQDSVVAAADPPLEPNAIASLQDGKALVAGGANAAVYDRQGDAWQETLTPLAFPVNQPETSHAVRLGDARVLVVGAGPTSQVYEPETGSWKATVEQPETQDVAAATLTRLADGRVMLAGGGTNFHNAKVQVFDPSDGLWTQPPNMRQERGGHAATLLANGQVLVSAGAGFGSGRGSELFVPHRGDKGKWRPAASTRNERSSHAQVRLSDGTALSLGGGPNSSHPQKPNGEALAVAQVFFPEAGADGQWRPTGSLNDARAQAGVARLSEGCDDRCGHVVTLGGREVASVERYVPRPEVTGVSPASGVAGSEVTLSGFGLSAVDEVTIAGQSVAFSVSAPASGPDSPGKITATVPQELDPGSVSVAASTTVGSGEQARSLDSLDAPMFTVTEPPSDDGESEDGTDEGGDDGTGDEGTGDDESASVGRVEDLTATAVSDTEVELGWSAVADGAGGVADQYKVVQSRDPIDDASDFVAAAALCGGVCGTFDPPPQAVGDAMTLTVGGLTPGSRYHYAIAPIDADAQRGPISASVSVTTTGQPPADDSGRGGDDSGGVQAPAAAGAVRVAGPGRVTTALAASQEAFGDGQADAAVLARADEFADALAGVPLATAKNAPLLLTQSQGLDGRVASELQRVLGDGGRVYLLGGPAALSQQVAAAVGDLGFEVVRLGGATRFETAAAIAEDGLGAPDRVLITTGTTFADAVTAGAAAAHTDAAVLLTAGDKLPPATAQYVQQQTPSVQHAVGGPAAAAAPQIPALVGATRYETAATVADELFDQPATAGLATGTAFPDSLTGGAHIAGYGGPMLLSPPDGLHPAAADYLTAQVGSVTTTVLYGGPAALNQAVADGAQAAVAAAGS
jgi:putative cell wall-binding protein